MGGCAHTHRRITHGIYIPTGTDEVAHTHEPTDTERAPALICMHGWACTHTLPAAAGHGGQERPHPRRCPAAAAASAAATRTTAISEIPLKPDLSVDRTATGGLESSLDSVHQASKRGLSRHMSVCLSDCAPGLQTAVRPSAVLLSTCTGQYTSVQQYVPLSSPSVRQYIPRNSTSRSDVRPGQQYRPAQQYVSVDISFRATRISAPQLTWRIGWVSPVPPIPPLPATASPTAPPPAWLRSRPPPGSASSAAGGRSSSHRSCRYCHGCTLDLPAGPE